MTGRLYDDRMTGQHDSGQTRFKLLQDFITDLPFPAGNTTTDDHISEKRAEAQIKTFNFDLICSIG